MAKSHLSPKSRKIFPNIQIAKMEIWQNGNFAFPRFPQNPLNPQFPHSEDLGIFFPKEKKEYAKVAITLTVCKGCPCGFLKKNLHASASLRVVFFIQKTLTAAASLLWKKAYPFFLLFCPFFFSFSEKNIVVVYLIKASWRNRKHKPPIFKKVASADVFLFSDRVKAIPSPYQVQVKTYFLTVKFLSKWEQSKKVF